MVIVCSTTLLVASVADPGGDLGEPWIPPFQASYTISIVLCSAQRGLVGTPLAS